MKKIYTIRCKIFGIQTDMVDFSTREVAQKFLDKYKGDDPTLEIIENEVYETLEEAEKVMKEVEL